MMRCIFFFAFAISISRLSAQQDTATETLRNDLKRLLSINTGLGYTTFDNPEGGRIESNATAAQIIEIVPPFLATNDPVAKKVCWPILGRAVLQKKNTLEQRRAIVQIICRHYLQNNEDLQTVDNILIQLHSKDFNEASKKHINKLLETGTNFYLAEAAQIIAMAQLKEKIPVLWSFVEKDIAEMERSDAVVLSALARMDDNIAAEKLCQLYQLERKKPDQKGLAKRHSVTRATELAFALHRTTLFCLLADFNQIDLNEKESGADYFWWPAQFLGEKIVSMLHNYPVMKEFGFDPYQLKYWLSMTHVFEISEK